MKLSDKQMAGIVVAGFVVYFAVLALWFAKIPTY